MAACPSVVSMGIKENNKNFYTCSSRISKFTAARVLIRNIIVQN